MGLWDGIKKMAGDVVNEAANSTAEFFSGKANEMADDLKNKMASLINFDDALEKLDEAQQTCERDISPLIDFVQNLKNYVAEGKGKVDDFVGNVNVENLYKTVEFVDELPIPGIDLICKSLKLILRLIKPSLKNNNALPAPNSSDASTSDNERKINDMIEMAMEDGVMTPEEKEFILKKAEALGLDVDMVELKIMKRSRRIKEG